MCSALNNFLNFSGRWAERLSLSLQAGEKALAAQDFYSAGWRAHPVGWVYYLRGLGHTIDKNYPAALEAYQEALAMYRAFSPESDDEANGLNSLAEVERSQGDFAAAERDYREALPDGLEDARAALAEYGG
jgi:tetratricopeptide (TPR) repeat protein